MQVRRVTKSLYVSLKSTTFRPIPALSVANPVKPSVGKQQTAEDGILRAQHWLAKNRY
jgi:hypothetical protein